MAYDPEATAQLKHIGSLASAISNTINTLDDDKVDKVSSATSGNIVVFGADGAITDSGSKFATDAEVAELINQYFPTTAGGNG